MQYFYLDWKHKNFANFDFEFSKRKLKVAVINIAQSTAEVKPSFQSNQMVSVSPELIGLTTVKQTIQRSVSESKRQCEQASFLPTSKNWCVSYVYTAINFKREKLTVSERFVTLQEMFASVFL